MSVKITLDDLIGTCPKCGGSGKPQAEPPVRSGGGSYGRQVVRFTGEPDTCGMCAGTGRRGLTDTGKAVAQFIAITRKYEERRLSL